MICEPPVQVTPDKAQACGYQCNLQPLQQSPTWWWQYDLQRDGFVALTFHESDNSAAEVSVAQQQQPREAAAENGAQRQPMAVPIRAQQVNARSQAFGT